MRSVVKVGEEAIDQRQESLNVNSGISNLLSSHCLAICDVLVGILPSDSKTMSSRSSSDIAS